MLKHWMTHAEYQHFISQAVTLLNKSQLKKLSSYSDSLDKLTSLNLDPIGIHLLPYYSYTGRPALNQPQILRSFILMLDQGVISLSKWHALLEKDDLLALMIGCRPDSLPPLGSYFDLIDRLWLQNPSSEKLGRKDLFPPGKNKKSSEKPDKGKKLPNRHPGIVKTVADYALAEKEFPFHFERLLQELFRIAAVIPSMQLGFIPSQGATIFGDGTCIHAHASPYGHKFCDCLKNGITSCSCDRHFSDPDTSWGWDNDLGSFFFGHTLYMLCCHNANYQIDLPLHIRLLDARRHDSVSGIISLAEFRAVPHGFSISNLCLDSANDNYPTYNLCKAWGIHPFIDLNSNRGRPDSIPGEISIDTDGAPLCQVNRRMVYWGALAPAAAESNGVARWPAARKTVAPPKIPAPPPLMAAVFIQNLTGMFASILPLPAARQSSKESITTGQVLSV